MCNKGFIYYQNKAKQNKTKQNKKINVYLVDANVVNVTKSI